MSRRTAAAIVVLAVAVGLAACSGDSTSGGIDTGGGATATPAILQPVAERQAVVADSASPSASSSPSESPSSAVTTSGDLTADEFTEYADAVQPWYDEIVAIEGDISSVLIAVDSNEISQGQAARRLERLGYKYDPRSSSWPRSTSLQASSEAHRAWLDGITFEALAVRAQRRVAESGPLPAGRHRSPGRDQLPEGERQVDRVARDPAAPTSRSSACRFRGDGPNEPFSRIASS